jgi:integrase/recombinase XerD
MIDSIFVKQLAIAKHKEAPLLRERETYLQYLAARGRPHAQLQNRSMELLHIIRVMEMSELREVSEIEIRIAAERWAKEEDQRRMLRGNKSSVARFSLAARSWFRFHGLLPKSRLPTCCFDGAINEFKDVMRSRLASETVRHYIERIRKFLNWAATKHENLSSISLQDIEEYLEGRRLRKFRPRTLKGDCQAIRSFLTYAEGLGWCRRGLARSIQSPIIRSRDTNLTGPSWKDVRRLIKDCNGSSWSDCRSQAILLLCSVYALRNSEVVRLSLDDFDWRSETFSVKRAKSGKTQQFPIQYELGESIIRYLRNGRPQCPYRHLFISQHPPYRPMKTVGPAVKRRMEKLGIRSDNLGPHSLRHACATELLRRGTPLRDIADFLGHRDIDSVSFYAKHDARSLREVAAFNLAGLYEAS